MILKLLRKIPLTFTTTIFVGLFILACGADPDSGQRRNFNDPNSELTGDESNTTSMSCTVSPNSISVRSGDIRSLFVQIQGGAEQIRAISSSAAGRRIVSWRQTADRSFRFAAQYNASESIQRVDAFRFQDANGETISCTYDVQLITN